MADQSWLDRTLTPGIENILVSGYKKMLVGCRIHPTYRMLRKPATSCKRCQALWELKKELETLERGEKLLWEQFNKREAAERKKWAEHQEMLEYTHQ